MNRKILGLALSSVGVFFLLLGVMYPLNYISKATYVFILILAGIFSMAGISIRPSKK